MLQGNWREREGCVLKAGVGLGRLTHGVFLELGSLSLSFFICGMGEIPALPFQGDFILKSDNSAGKPWEKVKIGLSGVDKYFCRRALWWQLSEHMKKEIMKATEKTVLWKQWGLKHVSFRFGEETGQWVKDWAILVFKSDLTFLGRKWAVGFFHPV